MKLTKAYTQWLKQVKERVRSAQIKAALKVNEALLALYWEMGKEIVEKEEETRWGGKLIEQLSKDLSKESQMSGDCLLPIFIISKDGFYFTIILVFKFCHKLWQNPPDLKKCNRLLHQLFHNLLDKFRGGITGKLLPNARTLSGTVLYFANHTT